MPAKFHVCILIHDGVRDVLRRRVLREVTGMVEDSLAEAPQADHRAAPLLSSQSASDPKLAAYTELCNSVVVKDISTKI